MENREDHLLHIWKVLEELRGNGLTVNLRKCHLRLMEVQYMGFWIGHGLIIPHEKTGSNNDKVPSAAKNFGTCMSWVG